MTDLKDLNQRAEVPEAGFAAKAATQRKLFISTQHSQGASETYHSSITGLTQLLRDGSNPLTISWTPEVASWWEVVTSVSIFRLDGPLGSGAAGIQYAYLGMNLSPAPTAGPNNDQWLIGHTNADIAPHRGRMVTGLWALNAGVAYTCRAWISPGGGTWSYHRGVGHLLMYGRGWAR